MVKFDYRMPSRLDAIPVLADAVADWLGGESHLAFQVNLCLEELLTNTITYGLACASDHEIRVRLAQRDGWLEVRINDDAPPFDPFAEVAFPDLEADVDDRPIGGLGVHFVRTLMDEVCARHDGTGNELVLRKRLGGTPEE